MVADLGILQRSMIYKEIAKRVHTMGATDIEDTGYSDVRLLNGSQNH